MNLRRAVVIAMMATVCCANCFTPRSSCAQNVTEQEPGWRWEQSRTTTTTMVNGRDVPERMPGPAMSAPDNIPYLSGNRETLPTPQGMSGANDPAATGRPVIGVQVSGNKTVAEAKVMSYLKTRRGRDFDPDLLQADKRRLLQSGLFRDVRVATQEGPGGVVVTFEVFERPTIQYIQFRGNRGIRDKTLLKQSDLKVKDALNQYTVEEGRRKVEEFYHSKGYPKAVVSILEGDQPSDQGVVFVVSEGALQRISKVEFIGNDFADSGRLKLQVQSKPGFLWYFFGGKVERKKIDEDVERITAYYRSLGFFRARVGRELDFDDEGEWLKLKFIIDEGPRYIVRNVTVVGNDKFATDTLMQQLELKSGEYFNQAKMNRDVGTLKDEYGARGHVFADIQADPRFLEEPGEIDLVYKVKEGEVFRVGQINVKIQGEYPHTRHSTVMNRVSLLPGTVIDIREVRRSEQRLKGSQLFEVDPSKGMPPQVVVKPPDLRGVEEQLAEQPKPRAGSRTYRGQSPDDESERGRTSWTSNVSSQVDPSWFSSDWSLPPVWQVRPDLMARNYEKGSR